MSRFLLLLSLSVAQSIPDTVLGFDVSGDSVTLTIHKLFRGGWSLQHYIRSGSAWQETRRDTALLDTQGHIMTWTVWVGSGASSFIPSKRYELSYGSQSEVILTYYEYQAPIFIPRQRFYGYGWAESADSLAAGWLGVFIIDHNMYTGSAFWPVPFHWLQRQWGDSLRVEDFDPQAQVFIENSGYALKQRLSLCDSFSLFQTSGNSRTWQGESELCYDAQGRVIQYQDTFCTPTDCIKLLRLWSYDANGLPNRDSTHLRQYTPAGQLLSEFGQARTYEWDGQARLKGAQYPLQRYVLTYGSGQVLSLGAPSPARALFSYLSPQRLIQIQASAPLRLTLYTLQGTQIWAAYGMPGETVALPPTLPPGAYLLQGLTNTDAAHRLIYVE